MDPVRSAIRHLGTMVCAAPIDQMVVYAIDRLTIKDNAFALVEHPYGQSHVHALRELALVSRQVGLAWVSSRAFELLAGCMTARRSMLEMALNSALQYALMGARDDLRRVFARHPEMARMEGYHGEGQGILALAHSINGDSVVGQRVVQRGLNNSRVNSSRDEGALLVYGALVALIDGDRSFARVLLSSYRSNEESSEEHDIVARWLLDEGDARSCSGGDWGMPQRLLPLIILLQGLEDVPWDRQNLWICGHREIAAGQIESGNMLLLAAGVSEAAITTSVRLNGLGDVKVEAPPHPASRAHQGHEERPESWAHPIAVQDS